MESKEFINKCKLYLAAITDRRATEAFVCYHPQDGIKFILSNATKRKGKDAAEDNRITYFRISDLALHTLSFKDKTFEQTLFSILPQSQHEWYKIDIRKFIAVLDEVKDITKLKLEIRKDKKIVLTNKDYFSYEDRHIIGYFVETFHPLRNIVRFINENDPQDQEVISEEITTEPVIKRNRTYLIELDLYRFNHEAFKKGHRYAHIISIDGLTSVSYKSFLKKVKADSHPRLIRETWLDKDKVRMRHKYEDDNIVTISYRPNIFIIPLLKTIPLDKHLQIE